MSYEQAVVAHYDKVAEVYGDSPSSTMEDLIIREKETKEITDVVARYIAHRRCEYYDGPDRKHNLRIADIGCGNGYTLSVWEPMFRDPTKHEYIGGEFNDKLLAIAKQRLNPLGIQAQKVDIRDKATLPNELDVLICQRVLINLLDINDQQKALINLIDAVKPGGLLVFIEVMQSGLDNLNAARAEFDLPPIPPAHHNLPLPDGFFNHPALTEWGKRLPRNFLSSHYFVSRVFDAAMRKATKTDFVRNSHFVKFFSGCLEKPVGDYAPLQGFAFLKQYEKRNW